MKKISRLLQRGAIKQVKTLETNYVFSIFLREDKKDKTTHRSILILKIFNENFVYQHFKMDNPTTVLNMARRNCYMASIHLQMYITQYLYYAWTQNTCYFSLREIYTNTHAYQIGRKTIKLWIIFMTLFLMGDTFNESKNAVLESVKPTTNLEFFGT